MKLAVLISHPIQYYAPIFRALAARCDLHVFYGQRITATQQSEAGFKQEFDWDIDLLSGYASTVLRNVSRNPSPEYFLGCDTPEIGTRLRKERFDALVVAGWYLKSHVQAILAAKRIGLPVLVRGDSHLGTPRSWLKRCVKELVNPAFLRLFDGVLYVGQKSRAFYEYYHYPESRLFFSPHCVDNDWFAARATAQARVDLRQACGIGDDTLVVLFAGKVVPLKRPLDVIAAVARCRKMGLPVEVMVAGSGEFENDVRHHAGELHVPLSMLGFCNQTKMPAAYAAADVLVLPSGQETWGLVANEALACGRPVIVSDACGCAPDLAGDGVAGRVTPLGDIDAIAAAVSSLTECPLSGAKIRARSDAFSVTRAVDGIVEAAASVRRKQTLRRAT